MTMKATNHSIVQRTVVTNNTLKAGDNIVVAKVGGDNFLDALNILFLTKAVTTGVAKISLSLGSAPETVVIDAFLTAPDITSAITTSTDILNLSTALANGTKTNFKVNTLREILSDILSTKTTGHNLAKWHLQESSYVVLMQVVSGTIATDTDLGVEAVIGM